MAKKVRKRNKKRMRAFAMGFVALAFIIAAVLISQQKKLDAIAEEQAQLQEVIAAQNEEKARLEYMIEYSGSESYLESEVSDLPLWIFNASDGKLFDYTRWEDPRELASNIFSRSSGTLPLRKLK